jgi:hypothetical protein
MRTVYAFIVVLSIALLAIGSRSRSSAVPVAYTHVEIAAGGVTGCNNPNTVPVVTDVGQIIISCGDAVLTAVEKGATTFEEIVAALAGSTCGPVTVAEVQSIVQLFMGTSSLEAGTLPLDIMHRLQVPETQAKLKVLHHK